jgi:hypothetical protein
MSMPIKKNYRVSPQSEIVSSEVLTEIFKDKLPPFQLNADGSVNMNTYMEWLQSAGVAALQAFEKYSEIEISAKRTVEVQKQRETLCRSR